MKLPKLTVLARSIALASAIALCLLASAQPVVGSNFNVISGKGSGATAQPVTVGTVAYSSLRQNEPAVAASTRRPDPLMFGFNECKTVKLGARFGNWSRLPALGSLTTAA